MKKNIVWCKTSDEAKGYKYVASIIESDNSYPQLFASNNLRDLKSFVYNDIRVSFTTAKGHIYYSSDEYYQRPIYAVWRSGFKTYIQNLLNWY